MQCFPSVLVLNKWTFVINCSTSICAYISREACTFVCYRSVDEVCQERMRCLVTIECLEFFEKYMAHGRIFPKQFRMPLVARHIGLAYLTFRGTTEFVISWIDRLCGERTRNCGLVVKTYPIMLRCSCRFAPFGPSGIELRFDMRQEKSPVEKVFTRGSLGIFDAVIDRRICLKRNKCSHSALPLVFKLGKKYKEHWCSTGLCQIRTLAALAALGHLALKAGNSYCSGVELPSQVPITTLN